MPVECETSTDSRTSESVLSNEPTRSAMVLALGLMLRMTAMSPNGSEPSTRTTGFCVDWWSATARFVAIVVRPTPPLGEKKAMICPVSRATGAAATGPPGAGACGATCA